ncbi:PLP-dependent cysteine synthase family protein [Spirillospora sp. CA-294931]|uniref:PLP-dependent cysteine synthase family protein n=1 Tax=Spirillospora sp. CA-294931 TaxID=3240042 RepID=UPI003D8CACF1
MFADAVDACRIPYVVRLADNVHAVVYRLMKLLPAHHILRNARDQGRLGDGVTVVETTSGTFGLALAMECAISGHRLVLVSDPVVDARLRRRLEHLGAEVVIVHERAPGGGYQATRLARVAEIQATLPATFCPEQYSNPDNPGSYALAAELLTEQLGQIDCLVGSVGSGGSMCGTTRYLRQANPELTAIGVDTHRSVLFGQRDGHRVLRGLGNSLLPPNLDHGQFDEVHWLGAADAFTATRRLYREHALFMGPTSGAAYQVGSWWGRRNPGARTVIILPDEGYRYQDTVYDDAWLAANGCDPGARPGSPREVAVPEDAEREWCRMAWARRSLDEVVPGALLKGARS